MKNTPAYLEAQVFRNEWKKHFGTGYKINTHSEGDKLKSASLNLTKILPHHAIKKMVEMATNWDFALEIKRSGAGLRINFHA